MKVLHVIDSMEMGGAEKLVYQLCDLHRSQGYEVGVYCISNLGVLGEELRRQGTPVHFAGKDHLGHVVRHLAGVLRREKPTVVHCHNATATILAAPLARLYGVRTVISTRHGLVPPPHNTRREIKFGIAARFCDWVVAVCDATRENLARLPFANAHRLICIYNGTKRIPVTSRTHPANPGTFALVHVGRLTAEKDQATLLKAMALVAKTLKDVSLMVVGDGSLRASLEQLATELGISHVVNFTGEQPDVAPFLQRADVFVMSSVSEGLPVSLLEAISAGLPAIVTDVGGMPDVVSDRAGVVVPASNPEALASAIVSLYQNPERLEKLSDGALRRYAECFTPEAMADNYARLYAARTAERA